MHLRSPRESVHSQWVPVSAQPSCPTATRYDAGPRRPPTKQIRILVCSQETGPNRLTAATKTPQSRQARQDKLEVGAGYEHPWSHVSHSHLVTPSIHA